MAWDAQLERGDLGAFTLLPLAPLMLTGLYRFALPYAARRHAGEPRRSGEGGQ